MFTLRSDDDLISEMLTDNEYLDYFIKYIVKQSRIVGDNILFFDTIDRLIFEYNEASERACARIIDIINNELNEDCHTIIRKKRKRVGTIYYIERYKIYVSVTSDYIDEFSYWDELGAKMWISYNAAEKELKK